MFPKLENKLLNLTKVFSLIENNVLTLNDAAKLTNYSYWHFTRLYGKYQKSGIETLFKRNRNKKPTKLNDNNIELLKKVYLELNQPQISLLLYFTKLDYPSFPKISGEWVRQLLIRENVYCPGERKKVFRKRFEAPFPGILVQGDTSFEQWIPDDETYYHLIVFIDDCSRYCLGAILVTRDTIIEHFSILKTIVRNYGKFIALYYDNDEKYSYIRHNNSRFFDYTKEEADLQVIRALSEVGIDVINSKLYDPCGKGKIERFIETVQLQLPVWFRRYKVKTLSAANQILRYYIRYYNTIQIHREIGMTPQKKFLALRADSKFTPVGQEIDLAKIFSYRYERKVNRDNTLRFNGMVYQLKRRPYIYSYSGKKAEIRYLPDVFLSIYIDNELVEYRKLLTDTKNTLKSRNNDYEKVAIL
jgi:transposase InsO family protein